MGEGTGGRRYEGVRGEGLHGRWAGRRFQSWETAGLPLTSWLLGVSPITTAIRTKSLAWNKTNVYAVWPGESPIERAHRPISVNHKTTYRSLAYPEF